MPFCGLIVVVLASVINFSSARAVNISNTWMLPEEGFPVFYRYFRDRISWYEADAVCQFHHAYLVTADTTSQYDAIRAYLKELDITDNVWIGLSKTSEKPNFTWTDFRALSGEGHWQEAIPVADKDPMCVAMDPAKDFLWKPLSCGGPEVASFICEMPIPSWALGPQGCLLTELPSLTVLYIPEQSSLELTSDCGLDGTKRIACKGNADREEILKQLTCAMSHEDFEEKEKSTRPPIAMSTSADENSINGRTTKTWIWTSNTVDVDYGMPTRHRRETEDTLSPVSTKSTTGMSNKEKVIATSEIFTATNYDTEVTTNSLVSESTTDSTLVSEKTLEITDGQSSSLHDMDSTSAKAETSTFSSTVETKIARYVSSEPTSEYPSAINQGHLFSIIGNGTMFDIIELNDTTMPEHDLKIGQEEVSTPVQEPTYKPSKKLSQLSEKNYKNASEDNFKIKPVSKKDIYKSADPKKSYVNLYKNLTKHYESPEDKKVDDTLTKEVEMVPIVNDPSVRLNRTFRKGEERLSKEVPIFPVVKDTTVKLNRTFRKELPSNDYSELDSINEVPEVAKSVDNNLPETESNNDAFQNITLNKDILKKEEAISVTQLSQIDPKLDLLNSNLTKHDDSELVEFTASEHFNKTLDDTLKKQFLPKSLLGEKDRTYNNAVTENYTVTDDSVERGDNKSETQPKPNRQRQLTRPQRRSFYPYFFSRVLG